MSRRIERTVTADYDGKKVKHFLRGEMKISSRLMNSLKTYPDGIMLNGTHARTIDPIRQGDTVAVNIPDKFGEIEPVDIPLDILYEDDDVVVINKTSFLAMHPTHNHQGDTLANGLVHHLLKQNKPTVFRAVGRLDKGTSGITVCALNSHAASLIPSTAQKEYLAVVRGTPEKEGTFDIPIYRPDPMKTLRAAGEGGDRAVTHYGVLLSNGKYSLVRVWLETGRTHQIRVHFSSAGFPLAGDGLYSSDEEKLGHHLLHCVKVSFVHPVTREKMSFTAPMKDDMEIFVRKEFGENVEALLNEWYNI